MKHREAHINLGVNASFNLLELPRELLTENREELPFHRAEKPVHCCDTRQFQVKNGSLNRIGLIGNIILTSFVQVIRMIFSLDSQYSMLLSS